MLSEPPLPCVGAGLAASTDRLVISCTCEAVALMVEMLPRACTCAILHWLDADQLRHEVSAAPAICPQSKDKCLHNMTPPASAQELHLQLMGAQVKKCNIGG